MTDQIYYKIQYPLKKAITLMKRVNGEDLEPTREEYNRQDMERVRLFLARWKDEGKDDLHEFVKRLRKIQY